MIIFVMQKGAIVRGKAIIREAIISNIAHWKSCPKYFVLLYH